MEKSEIWKMLWKKYASYVLRVCGNYIKDESVLKDVRQEVFLRMIRSGKLFRNQASFKTWIYTITHNCCMDYLRKNASYKRLTKEYVPSNDFSVHDSDVPEWKVNEVLYMPCPLSQLMMELHYGEGWSKEEIAKAFGCSKATIDKRIQAGISNLQKIF